MEGFISLGFLIVIVGLLLLGLLIWGLGSLVRQRSGAVTQMGKLVLKGAFGVFLLMLFYYYVFIPYQENQEEQALVGHYQAATVANQPVLTLATLELNSDNSFRLSKSSKLAYSVQGSGSTTMKHPPLCLILMSNPLA